VGLLHDELRRIARSQMRRQAGDHTLQPTALVHEAYLRLFGRVGPHFRDRGHFMAAASRAMRTALVDAARRRRAAKRGAGAVRVTLQDTPDPSSPGHDLVDLHDALSRLERIDPAWSQVVELRYFGGLTVAETAALIGVSEPTVHRTWDRARTWLFRELSA
jgi:RNA polymerase sigma factor (TIGR02999 family)